MRLIQTSWCFNDDFDVFKADFSNRKATVKSKRLVLLHASFRHCAKAKMFCFKHQRCVFSPHSSDFTNLPVRQSLRWRLSSLWFMSLIKASVCVCVCVAQGHTVPYNHSTNSFYSLPPPSVADNSCECGCERFRSALVRLASLSGGARLLLPVC